MNNYILEGADGEYLIVIKSFDLKVITDVIDRIAGSRKEEIKNLAWELEKSLHDNGSRRNSGKTGPKDKAKSPNGNRGRCKEAANTKHRVKPGA